MGTVIYVKSGRRVRTCSAKCYNAVGDKCECICNGKNHGCGVDEAVKNTKKIINSVKKKYRHSVVKSKTNPLVEQLIIEFKD